MAAAKALRSAENLCVFTGAGVSAESAVTGSLTGLDGLSGVWGRCSSMELATTEAFAAHPLAVWQWYLARRRLIVSQSPNPAYRAIATLARRVPHCTVVTQNVDDMHERSGVSEPVRLHGSLMHMRCSAGCSGSYPVPEEEQTGPPRCLNCNSLMRPDVVWFGEAMSSTLFAVAQNAAIACDVFLSVGTSNTARPASSLPWLAAKHGATVIVVNTDMSNQRSGPSILPVQGAAEVVLPLLVAEAFSASSRVRRHGRSAE